MTNDYLIKTNFHTQAITVILSILTATIGSFVDGCVIGIYLGADNLAAFGYALPVILLLLSALGGALSDGSAATCAVHMGNGNTRMTNTNFSAACLLSVVFGCAITLLCVQFSEQLAAMVGAKGSILKPTDEYIRSFSFGAFPMIFTQVLMAYTRLDGDAILNVISVVLMTAINITLDILFISSLHLGIFGIGLATSISYTVAMLVCFLHFFGDRNTLSLIKSKNIPLEAKNIMTVGFPSLLNGACLSVRGLFLNNLLFLVGGVAAVSALSLLNNVYQFLVPVIMGMGITLSILTGIFYGEGDAGAMERVLRVSMKSGITVCLLMAGALFVFAPYAVDFMLGKSGAAGILAVRALRFFSFSLPLSLIVVNLLYYYQTTKNLTMANAICISHGLLCPVLAAFLFSGILGTDGVWLAFALGEALTLICLTVLFRIKNRKWPLSLKDFLLLPAGFEGQNRHVLDLSIRNDISKVMELSMRIWEFCGKYSQDEKKIERLSLCIEEMAGNIVAHGFKRSGERFIDIRIIIEEDEFIFRIRDNGVSFNPLKYADESTYGIRIVRGIAKSINYRNTMGINNLTITL